METLLIDGFKNQTKEGIVLHYNAFPILSQLNYMVIFLLKGGNYVFYWKFKKIFIYALQL